MLQGIVRAIRSATLYPHARRCSRRPLFSPFPGIGATNHNLHLAKTCLWSRRRRCGEMERLVNPGGHGKRPGFGRVSLRPVCRTYGTVYNFRKCLERAICRPAGRVSILCWRRDRHSAACGAPVAHPASRAGRRGETGSEQQQGRGLRRGDQLRRHHGEQLRRFALRRVACQLLREIRRVELQPIGREADQGERVVIDPVSGLVVGQREWSTDAVLPLPGSVRDVERARRYGNGPCEGHQQNGQHEPGTHEHTPSFTNSKRRRLAARATGRNSRATKEPLSIFETAGQTGRRDGLIEIARGKSDQWKKSVPQEADNAIRRFQRAGRATARPPEDAPSVWDRQAADPILAIGA
jgi:hypothetical protein